ncbi:MAG: nucleotidyl transferase AbiEii/AbiGii toxin family protein [Phycisphaeraceae bacterium]
MNDVSRALRDLVGIFESLDLAYAVMGGIAVRAYGIPRPTYDVDFTVAIPRNQLPRLFSTVQARGFAVPEQYLKGWVDEVSKLPLVKFRLYLQDKGVDVDVFLAESPYQQEVLKRRRHVEAPDGAVWLVTPEDLILLKMLAYRPRDVADIQDVMFTQGQLDETYLRNWATSLGISDRLVEMLKQQSELRG